MVADTTKSGERFECPPEHNHGSTTGCYTDHKCRCEKCRSGWRAYIKKWRREAKDRKLNRVDPAAARQRVKELREQGWTIKLIVEKTGLKKSTVATISDGSAKRITEDTERAIFEVPYAPQDSKRYSVPAYRVRRRIEALIAQGYSVEKIGRMAGIEAKQMSRLLHDSRKNCRRSTFNAIDTVFQAFHERHAEPRPPRMGSDMERIRKALTYAKKRGYVTSFYWTDIDNPQCRPCKRVGG